MTWRSVALALVLGGSLAAFLAYTWGAPAARVSTQLLPTAVAIDLDTPAMGYAPQIPEAVRQEARLTRVRQEAMREVSLWKARRSEK